MKHIIIFIFVLLLLVFLFTACSPAADSETEEGSVSKIPILIASYAEYPVQVSRCLVFCESVRTFAGSMRNAPIRVYLSEQLDTLRDEYKDRFSALNVELRTLEIPAEARRFYLAGKPHAAAQAEADAAGKADILAFLDANIIVIKEPQDFRLGPETTLGYRPVFHKNIGSLYSKPPDAFWRRIYQILKVPESAIFPMEAVADKSVLRPYINAGYLVVRPDRGVLRKWVECFTTSYLDPELAEMAQQDSYNIFLHQAALACAVMLHIERQEMIELPRTYNIPLFFEKFYDSEYTFDSLEGIVSFKYEFNFANLPEGWDQKLQGPSDVITWIKSHCK